MAPPIKYKNEEEKRIGRNLREKLRREKNIEKFKNYQKEYQEKNKEILDIKRKERYIKNKEKRLLYSKNWEKNNIERKRERKTKYHLSRMKNDPFYKFNCVTRSLIYQSFKRVNINKNNKTEEVLGCTLDEFRNYILSLCPFGVELKDFNRTGYHIDHKIPISSAKTQEEVIKLCHYSNLQPLWYSDNIRKSNKINL